MANIYTIELDGEIIELESDTEPTAEAVRAALGTSAPITADSSIGEIATEAVGNLVPNAIELGTGLVSMANPKNWQPMMEGMIDLSSAGMSKVLDATGLSQYADPAKMEKYRKYRGVVADEASELFTEEGLKKRIAEKPLTSLLDLTMAGRAISTPLKLQQYSSAANKVGQVLDKATDFIDPTSLITKPAGMLFEKVKTKADIKASEMADVDVKNKSFTEQGFVIPPSLVESAGTGTKMVESLLGDGTKKSAIKINQNIFDKKARQYTSVEEGTPLTEIIKTIEKRQAPIYKEVKGLKPVVLKTSKTTTTIPTGKLTPETIKTKKVLSRSGAEIFKDIQSLRKKRGEAYKNAKNKAERNGVEIDDSKIKKISQKLDNVEAELEVLAKKSGNDKLLEQLQTAREDYARGFAVENAVKKGHLDAISFAKMNKRNKKPVDGAGKEIIDFVDEYSEVSKPLAKKTWVEGLVDKVKTTAAASAIGGLNLAAAPYTIPAFLGAKALAPNLLLSKPVQKTLSSGNYMPTGSGLLNAASSRGGVGAATFIPSLLQTAKAEYAPYLYEEDPSIPTINIRGGGAR